VWGLARGGGACDVGKLETVVVLETPSMVICSGIFFLLRGIFVMRQLSHLFNDLL